MKRSYKLASMGVAAFILAAGVLVATGTANAAAVEEDCKTATTTVTNHPDNGHGSPTHWANDNYTRVTKVCLVAEPQAALKSVEVPAAHYAITVTDHGTFTTVGGAHRSPNNGHALKGGVTGEMKGGFTADIIAPAGWQFFNLDALNGKTFTGESGTEAGGPTTSTWVKALWSAGIGEGSKPINDDWAWVYQTCNEYWIDSLKTDDGTSSKAGDITGYSKTPCPRAVFEDNCDGTFNVIIFNDAPYEKAVLKFKLSSDAIVRELVGQEQWSTSVNADSVKVYYYGRSWKVLAEHKWKKPSDCVTPTTPAPTTTAPTTTATPTSTPSATPTSATPTSATPTTATTTPAAPVGGGDDGLPVTGSSVTMPIVVGSVFVLGGVGLLIALYVRSRRRQEQSI